MVTTTGRRFDPSSEITRRADPNSIIIALVIFVMLIGGFIFFFADRFILEVEPEREIVVEEITEDLIGLQLETTKEVQFDYVKPQNRTQDEQRYVWRGDYDEQFLQFPELTSSNAGPILNSIWSTSSIRIREINASLLGAGTLRINIYNSTRVNERIVPDTLVFLNSTGISLVTSWVTYNLIQDIPLDNGKTTNNVWFVGFDSDIGLITDGEIVSDPDDQNIDATLVYDLVPRRLLLRNFRLGINVSYDLLGDNTTNKLSADNLIKVTDQAKDSNLYIGESERAIFFLIEKAELSQVVVLVQLEQLALIFDLSEAFALRRNEIFEIEITKIELELENTRDYNTFEGTGTLNLLIDGELSILDQAIILDRI